VSLANYDCFTCVITFIDDTETAIAVGGNYFDEATGDHINFVMTHDDLTDRTLTNYQPYGFSFWKSTTDPYTMTSIHSSP